MIKKATIGIIFIVLMMIGGCIPEKEKTADTIIAGQNQTDGDILNTADGAVFTGVFGNVTNSGNKVTVNGLIIGNVVNTAGTATYNCKIVGNVINTAGAAIYNDSIAGNVLNTAGAAIYKGKIGGDVQNTAGAPSYNEEIAGNVTNIAGAATYNGIKGIVTIIGGTPILKGMIAGAVVLNGDVEFNEATLNQGSALNVGRNKVKLAGELILGKGTVLTLNSADSKLTGASTINGEGTVAFTTAGASSTNVTYDVNVDITQNANISGGVWNNNRVIIADALSLTLGGVTASSIVYKKSTGAKAATGYEQLKLKNSIIKRDVLPLSYSLARLPPVFDQRTLASCVSCTLAYVKTWEEGVERKWTNFGENQYFSGLYFYNQVNKGSNVGTSYPDNFEVAKNGAALLSAFAYSTDYLIQPAANVLADAYQYRILDYSRVSVDKDSIKKMLASGYPVMITLKIYCPQFWLDTTYDFKNINAQSIDRGYHAITLVGYDDAKQSFKFANSWGQLWNDNGFGYLNYDSLQKFVIEAYVAEDSIAASII